MKRTLAAALFVSLFASTAAFAGGIGHNGTYQDPVPASTSTKTRAEVRAEIVAAQRDGTLPALNKQSYPDLSLAGETQAERVALSDSHDARVQVARAGQ